VNDFTQWTHLGRENGWSGGVQHTGRASRGSIAVSRDHSQDLESIDLSDASRGPGRWPGALRIRIIRLTITARIILPEQLSCQFLGQGSFRRLPDFFVDEAKRKVSPERQRRHHRRDGIRVRRGPRDWFGLIGRSVQFLTDGSIGVHRRRRDEDGEISWGIARRRDRMTSAWTSLWCSRTCSS
jgi:hypothetical protein